MDTILLNNYWYLRGFSVIDYPENPLGIVFRDLYSLQCNLETLYHYDSINYFSNEIDRNLFIQSYIKPLLYTHKIAAKINFKSYPTKNIKKFIWLYSGSLIDLHKFKSKLMEFGIKPPSDYNYRISRKWLDYPDSIKKVNKKILLMDWRMSSET